MIKSIALIMDGNRRWAVENGMSKLDGHKYGAEKMLEVIDWVKENNIENLTVYAFSTENWNRTKIEVEVLMRLFENFFSEQLEKFIEKEVSVRFVGSKNRFSKKIQGIMEEVEEKTKDFKTNFFVAFSYGGRLEIVEAAKKIIQSGLKAEDLTEEEFEKYLWTDELPDPEIVVRTGGDHRISNFLLWKIAYSEFVFLDTKWPAFSKEEFQQILADYEKVRINKGK